MRAMQLGSVADGALPTLRQYPYKEQKLVSAFVTVAVVSESNA